MEKENLLVQVLVAGISGGIIVLLVYLGKKAQNIHLWGKRKSKTRLENEPQNHQLKENLNIEFSKKYAKKIKDKIIYLGSNFIYRIKNFFKKHYKIILIIIGVFFLFYWIQIRPNILKRNCYYEATKIAIKEMRDEKSKPFLYDRKNWKTYKKTDDSNSYESFLKSKNGIFADIFIDDYSFEENIKNEIEPSYIQENLDRISKENNFYDEDYDKYYERCLQKNGL